MISPTKIISLKTSDNVTFCVEYGNIRLCKTIHNQIVDLGDDLGVIELPNVTSDVFEKVLTFGTNASHIDEEEPADASSHIRPLRKKTVLSEFEAEFVQRTSGNIPLLLAANYLDYSRLLRVLSFHMASLVKNKDAAQIREMFGLAPVFTPEEEAQLRDEIAKMK